MIRIDASKSRESVLVQPGEYLLPGITTLAPGPATLPTTKRGDDGDTVKKIIITGWSAQLKCSDCGHEYESRVYGRWEIDSSTITTCPNCKKVTNHVIIGSIAETTDYDEYLEKKNSSPNN